MPSQCFCSGLTVTWSRVRVLRGHCGFVPYFSGPRSQASRFFDDGGRPPWLVPRRGEGWRLTRPLAPRVPEWSELNGAEACCCIRVVASAGSPLSGSVSPSALGIMSTSSVRGGTWRHCEGEGTWDGCRTATRRGGKAGGAAALPPGRSVGSPPRPRDSQEGQFRVALPGLDCWRVRALERAVRVP